jgi:hypothetical protein
MVSGSILIQVIISVVIFSISPARVEDANFWRTGSACLSAIFGLGLLPLISGMAFARKGLPLRARTTGLLLGLSSGLAVESLWRLHCPFSAWGHVVSFHGGAIVLSVLLGIGMARHWQRRNAKEFAA